MQTYLFPQLCGMTHPQGGKNTDGARTTVLDQGAGDDLQGLGHGAVWPLLHPGEGARVLRQAV